MHTFKGVLIRTVKYGDSSLILTAFTEEAGVKSFITSRKKSKSKSNTALLQPLAIIEIAAYHSKGDLHRAREIKNAHLMLDIRNNMLKGAIVQFLNELLVHVLNEPDPYPQLYHFIVNSLTILETADEFANFHLVFLIQMAGILGIHPDNNFCPETPVFDLQEGRYVSKTETTDTRLPDELNQSWSQLIDCTYESAPTFTPGIEKRRALLRELVRYYHLHANCPAELRSLEVLEEIFN